MSLRALIATVALVAVGAIAQAGYTNFEASHVHPIDLTPSGARLLAVNTPDALLELFAVQPDGSLVADLSIPVGLEPVTVVARSETEAWVVNQLSDSVSVVNLTLGVVTHTLDAGDEPTDVVFAAGRAFVTSAQEDSVRVFDVGNPRTAPVVVPLFGRAPRALAVSGDGQTVYAVVLRSGNGTTVVNANIVFGNNSGLDDAVRLPALGLTDIECAAPGPPLYPPYPPGIARNPALNDPPASANPLEFPPVGLIVRWDGVRWVDEAGEVWSHCLDYRPADHDLFMIDATSLAVTEVDGLGTSLFEVSVHPNGKIYVPHTEARNFVRFEHPLGLEGHVVDNRYAVVDPANANAVTHVDLNGHINRASDPATNLAERNASLSQPGMLVWRADGSRGYQTAIGTRKLFRVDGSCLAAGCIFGASRAAPDAVEVGEGPTGVALLEGATDEQDRLYVLNRISHSIAVVAADTMQKVDEVPLHDPSSDATRLGRRFLYDAVDGSGHGDAACSSCHPSGDHDGLAWDLGNPAGEFVPYTTTMDNVRFILPINGNPEPCDSFCTTHLGFDPQKGPMTTQTLRNMLEPLHWRGDRATMRDFNAAFVDLMGAADIGPINGKPAGLTALEMDRFRDFALEMQFPPNPHREVDDTVPDQVVSVHGNLQPGNPAVGETLFDTHASDSGQPCKACHSHPFGAAGGTAGGVEPTEPTSTDTAGLFFGTADGSPHNDLKVPHLRNMYDKFGPVLGTGATEAKTLFGYTHDGSAPDLLRFLSATVFTLDAQQVRDLAAFMFHFPTGTKPAVGAQLTLDAGTPPTGTAAEESLLQTLIVLGDLSSPGRHCELVASTIVGGAQRRYHRSGSGWVTDTAAEPPVATVALREAATQPITFLCSPIGSGARLGGDRDEDLVLDGDDCAPADPTTLVPAATVTDLALSALPATQLSWGDQSPSAGSSIRYEVLGGELSTFAPAGVSCVEVDPGGSVWVDPRPDPAPGAGLYYLVRAVNPCGAASLGAGRGSLDELACPSM